MLKLIKFEEKSQFLFKVMMDCSVYKEHKDNIWDKALPMGHYLLVAYTTHLP